MEHRTLHLKTWCYYGAAWRSSRAIIRHSHYWWSDWTQWDSTIGKDFYPVRNRASLIALSCNTYWLWRWMQKTMWDCSYVPRCCKTPQCKSATRVLGHIKLSVTTLFIKTTSAACMTFWPIALLWLSNMMHWGMAELHRREEMSSLYGWAKWKTSKVWYPLKALPTSLWRLCSQNNNKVIVIDYMAVSLYTIKRTIKFKRYVDYNFTFDSCLPDYG